MNMRESGEMYLETVLILSHQKEKVRAVDISEYMGFSKPSVSRAVNAMRDEGLLSIDEGKCITLTGAGFEIAEKIYDRHRLLSSMLERLGVDEITAQRDACRMEHVISETTMDAIREHAGRFNKQL